LRKSSIRPRLYVIFIVFIGIFVFYVTRLTLLHVYPTTRVSTLADNQHNIILQLKPKRGDILDRNLNKLAVDYNVYSVFAVPMKIPADKKDRTARLLSKTLKIDEGLIRDRLMTDQQFAWIKREVEKSESDKVKALDLDGVELRKENKRFYPNGALASHIIGFSGLDDNGLEGIEFLCNGYLKGTPGWRWTIRDAKRRDIASGDEKIIPPADGLNVVLTIDEAIQHIAERELDKAFKKHNAKAASIIVMDPANGDILALANRPAYDLNEFSASSEDERRNRAVTDIYEPGSVFKVVTAACALEKGLVEPEQEFFCENGAYRIGGRILHDHHPYENLTFRQVIEKSSNIGVTKIAELIGKEGLYKYIKLFGFGELSEINMPGEAAGILRPPKKWSAVSISAIPIGQEVGVTTVQLASAISVIANDGYLMKPRIISRIVDKEGRIIKEFAPERVRRVLSSGTLEIMREILMGVVENGTGKRARLKRYTSAGKTGTAQKIGFDGRYSHSKFFASFMGFAPGDDPKIAIVVSVDEPTPVYYGGSVSAPVFKNVADEVLKYLKVEADKVEKSAKEAVKI